MNLRKQFMVKPGGKFRLSDHDPDEVCNVDEKKEAVELTLHLTGRLVHLQKVLYAEHKRSLLIILQGMDASGKDGTISHVMSGVNPQGCYVTAFKEPTKVELDHDFLWRVHQHVPGRGIIGIFNRSHYEDVLVVRVHNLVPKDVWSKRYDQINAFEEILAENNVVILKFFLNISKDEQARRLEERKIDPEKSWKISEADEAERKFWDDYQAAYQDAIGKCSTKYAPWFVIPANKKWFRNLAVSQIIVDMLDDLKLKYPTQVNLAKRNSKARQ
ncbi:MAG: polyphosphate:nucleotide phosphotransferase, family [Bryobacterales bacterium]|nr:polyphosphate:nucleotide phosphotransferase, family [Bryobacterales bacterium]